MEKIIELLNEAIRNWLDFQWNDILKIGYYSETDIRAYYDNTARAYYNITYEDIISKRAGFIKRLVINDKIDFDNRDLKDEFMLEFERYPVFQGNTYNWDFNENWMIMLLSIQEDPVSFLISVLK
jgi:hypothetical protein